MQFRPGFPGAPIDPIRRRLEAAGLGGPPADLGGPRRAAMRAATPNSQLPTESRFRIEPALRARIRKVAWNASSAVSDRPASAGRRETPSARGDERGPRRRSRQLVALGREPIEQLPVGQSPDRPDLEQGGKLPLEVALSNARHGLETPERARMFS